MSLGVGKKDPQEVRIYTRDWTNELNEGATISSSTWVVAAGITKDADGIVAGLKKTSIKLSGGTAGVDYDCTNTVLTSDGETLERTGIVRVRQQ